MLITSVKIIKGGEYNVIEPEPFELSMPCEFELLYGNTVLQHFWISADGSVDFSFNTDTKIPFLTPVLMECSTNVKTFI